jgi:hypothetical protein
MNPAELYDYIKTYLQAQACELLEDHPAYIKARLSEKADRDIGNRPYYWMFVERTGAAIQPMEITFIFDEEALEEPMRGEMIRFGNPRLHQIFASAKKHGQFIRLYEEIENIELNQGLVPWLMLNYKISFISDQKKDIFYPVGINLISGKLNPHFDHIITQYKLSPKIPDYHFTLSPIFSISSALKHIEAHIHTYISHEDTKWAEAAHQRLDEEIELLSIFFASDDVEQDIFHKRKEEINHYRPKIKVSLINGGMIYLHSSINKVSMKPS